MLPQFIEGKELIHKVKNLTIQAFPIFSLKLWQLFQGMPPEAKYPHSTSLKLVKISLLHRYFQAPECNIASKGVGMRFVILCELKKSQDYYYIFFRRISNHEMNQ